MTRLLKYLCLLFGPLILAAALLTAVLAGAQQINPTASAVKEDQLLAQSKQIRGECLMADVRACTLEQPRGRNWRFLYQIPLRLIGGGAILVMLAFVAGFYLIRGPVRIEHGRSGRVMIRFSLLERIVHWTATFCFIVLALSGLNLTFGKAVILPLLGGDAFSAISRAGKYAHNYLSVPFTLSVLLMFVMWIKWNIPSRVDIQWMMEGGGFGEKHPPADLFNAGQKSIYWVVVLGGFIVAATGYLLMVPFSHGITIFGMQLTHLIHALVALLYMAAMVFHVYMGTVGEEGAFEGMWDGTVDEEWAKQHHSIWHEREARQGNVFTPPVEGIGKVQPAE